MRTLFPCRMLVCISVLLLAAVASHAETDVAVSLYVAFQPKSTATSEAQSPANQAGGLLEVRHIHHPWIGYELTYAMNRSNQTTSPLIWTCPVATTPCTVPTVAQVKANAHQVTADWVVSVKVASFRPFALGGAGLLFDQPSSGQTSTQSQTKPVFVYGAGLDWELLPHLGLRGQYRGNLYKVPNLTKLYTSIDAFRQTSEPSLGVYFRF